MLPASLIALLIGAPGAFALGWTLRRIAEPRIHVVLFAAYGALFGTLVAWMAAAILGFGRESTAVFLFLPFVVACSAAFGIERSRAIRRLTPAPSPSRAR